MSNLKLTKVLSSWLLPTTAILITGWSSAHEQDHDQNDSNAITRHFEIEQIVPYEAVRELRNFMRHGNRASLGLFLANHETGELVIAEMADDSPSAMAGVKEGDVVTGIDDTDLTGDNARHEILVDYLRTLDANARVDLHVEREGETMTFEIETIPLASVMPSGPVMGEVYINKTPMSEWIPRPEFYSGGRMWSPGQPPQGMLRRHLEVPLTALNEDLAEYFQVDEGVLVLESPGESTLRAGDVITAVGDDSISDVDELLEALRGNAENVSVKRKRKDIEMDTANVLDALGFEREVSIRPRDTNRRSWSSIRARRL